MNAIENLGYAIGYLAAGNLMLSANYLKSVRTDTIRYRQDLDNAHALLRMMRNYDCNQAFAQPDTANKRRWRDAYNACQRVLQTLDRTTLQVKPWRMPRVWRGVGGNDLPGGSLKDDLYGC